MQIAATEISDLRFVSRPWHSRRVTKARQNLYTLLMSIKPAGLTANAWASRAGVSRSFFTDVRGGTNPRTDTLEKVVSVAGYTLAQFYDLDGARTVAPPKPDLVDPLPFRGVNDPLDIPLLGTAQGSDLEIGEDGSVVFVERMDLDLANVVEYLRRPPSLAGRDDVYAITVIGNSCAPRYEDGDPAYVEGRRQPSPGDYVVVQLKQVAADEEERLHIALFKQLVRRTSAFVELRQSNPDLTFQVPLSEVHAIHRVKPWREVVFF